MPPLYIENHRIPAPKFWAGRGQKQRFDRWKDLAKPWSFWVRSSIQYIHQTTCRTHVFILRSWQRTSSNIHEHIKKTLPLHPICFDYHVHYDLFIKHSGLSKVCLVRVLSKLICLWRWPFVRWTVAFWLRKIAVAHGLRLEEPWAVGRESQWMVNGC